MDRLPYELVDAILKAYVYSEFKNDVLELRLVCRLFDRILKPFVCRTLELEFSRLNKASTKPRPQTDALQTIGYHCKSLYIDMMVLRDDVEVNFLNTVFARVPAMEVFCQSLQKYCMSDATFTEMEYFNAVDSLLFNCREIERLRLNLPFQLVGRHCSATTIVLANTFKALAERHEQDPVSLKVMVLENVTDVALCSLWLNPSDIKNIMKTVAVLEHLVITLRRHSTEAERVDVFGSCFWNVIERAQHLQSLCIVGMDHDDRPHRGVKQTKYFHMPLDDWRWRGLPAPRLMLNNLTCLELKRLEITPEAMFQLSEEFGETLQEIYLNEVYLKAEQSSDWNEDSQKVLWVGVPNERPGFGCRWIAIVLRYFARHLRICRASFLTYDQYLMDDIEANLKFDFTGPCGLGRSVSQRFVEVVMGVRQPNTPSGQPVEFLPPDSKYDWMLDQLIDRQPHWKVTDYDTNAYQIAVENTTSSWQKSIDGVFTNCNANTLDELHYIAETASHGMNEVQQRRNGWTTASGLASEYTHNLLLISAATDNDNEDEDDDDHEDMDEDEDDDMDDDEDDYDEDGDDEDDFDEDEELVDAD